MEAEGYNRNYFTIIEETFSKSYASSGFEQAHVPFLQAVKRSLYRERNAVKRA